MDDLIAFVLARLDERERLRLWWQSADPKFALRTEEAIRKILICCETIAASERIPDSAPYPDGYASAMKASLKILAQIWSDHPDYPR